MKKLLLAVAVFFTAATGAVNAQSETNDAAASSATSEKSTLINFEGIYGISEAYRWGNDGAVGVGVSAWFPVNEFYIDAGLDFTFSESRNYPELSGYFIAPFSLLNDDKLAIEGYAGAGIVLGRVNNKEKFFGNGVKDYNSGGVLGNVGLNFKPTAGSFSLYLDFKTGIVSVPGWDESVRTPFKVSLGGRFGLK